MESEGVLEQLEALDIDGADAATIADAHESVRRLRGRLDSLEARLARRGATLHESGRGVTPEDALAHGGTRSRRDAERARRRAEVLGRAPALDEQLAQGRIGREHVDALASAVGDLDDQGRAALLDLDADLACTAAATTPEQFRRFLRRTVDQLTADEGVERGERQRAAAKLTFRFDHETGMGRIHGDLDPESYQRIRRAVDAETHALRKLPGYDGVPAGRVAVDALVNLTTGARSNARRNRADVVVHIDHDTLLHGLHEHSVCEYSDAVDLPPETARRLACEAGVIPVVLGGDSRPLDVGRATRLATPAQRTALRSMYRTCAIDACDRAFDACEVHHLVEWPLHGGETDLVNLLPLCSHHHHRAHEGGWRLDLDPATRVLTVRLPDGTLHSRCPPDLAAARTARPAA